MPHLHVAPYAFLYSSEPFRIHFAKYTIFQRLSSLSQPRISICLPVLNAGKYLEARIESIFAQSFSNWELIVVDGYSDDGSWEFLVNRCSGDSRVQLHQQQRQGIYAAINHAIGLASADYFYIATADDTMESQCLERLLELAVGQDGPCIAQCGLTLIDHDGIALHEEMQWPRNTEWYSVFGEQFEKSHLRKAPCDGGAIMLFGTIITSLTQALFPREAFIRLGGFPKQFGSAGDMAWEGLIGFFYEIRYTPERLATWRWHETQATRNPSIGENDWLSRRESISGWILAELSKHNVSLAGLARKMALSDYARFLQVRWANRDAVGANRNSRMKVVLDMLYNCPDFYLRYLFHKFLRLPGDSVTCVRYKQLTRYLGAEPFTELSPAYERGDSCVS